MNNGALTIAPGISMTGIMKLIFGQNLASAFAKLANHE